MRRAKAREIDLPAIDHADNPMVRNQEHVPGALRKPRTHAPAPTRPRPCKTSARGHDSNYVLSTVSNERRLCVERIGRQPAPMLADCASLVERRVAYTLAFRGEFVGMAVMLANNDHWFVETIAVRQAQQRRGLGRDLMQRAAAACCTRVRD